MGGHAPPDQAFSGRPRSVRARLQPLSPVGRSGSSAGVAPGGAVSVVARVVIVAGPTRQQPPMSRAPDVAQPCGPGGVEGDVPAPAPRAGVPPLAAVGVDHGRFPGHADGELHCGPRLRGIAAVDPDGDDQVVPGGDREGLRQVLSGPGPTALDRVGEPHGHPAPLGGPQQRLRLLRVRNGLQRQDVRLRRGEHLDPGPVELRELPHGQPVPSPVLTAVREHRAVRPHGRGDPDLLPHAPGRGPGELHTPREEPRRLVAADAPTGEALEGCLVAGGDEHPRVSPVRTPRAPPRSARGRRRAAARTRARPRGRSPVPPAGWTARRRGRARPPRALRRGYGPASSDRPSHPSCAWTCAEISSRWSRSSRSRTWR